MNILWHWCLQMGEGSSLIRILSKAERTQPILDLIQKEYSPLDDVKCIVAPVEASLPIEPEEPPDPGNDPGREPSTIGRAHISREELLLDVQDGAKLNKVFLAMVLLSSVVAAIGVLRSNTAVVIGAMVIAPLLGPNVALSLAANLSDTELAFKSAKVLLIGVSIALAVSFAAGLVFHIDPASAEISSRTTVDMFDLILALASGAAGSLAFTSGVPSALVGVSDARHWPFGLVGGNQGQKGVPVFNYRLYCAASAAHSLHFAFPKIY